MAKADAKLGTDRNDLNPAAAGRQGAAAYIVAFLKSVVIGALGAVAAVLLRLALPLEPEVLPFALLVIATCLVTVSAGLAGGITTMVLGGLLSWHFLLAPDDGWQMGRAAWIALGGYAAVGLVILGTSQLYRLSERKRQAHALAVAEAEIENQRLFATEMSHRMKNIMAIVQSIAGQTFTHDSPDVGKFAARLTALAEAQSLLNDHVTSPHANVREVIEASLRPFDDGDGRVELNGPDLPLRDQQAITLALSLHELATNAVKYGALGPGGGRISIRWGLAGDQLELDWKEQGGPPVRQPATTGFGLKLLGRKALGSHLEFEPDGLRCSIRQPYYGAA